VCNPPPPPVKRCRVSVDDDAAPANMQPLLALLGRLSQRAATPVTDAEEEVPCAERLPH